MSFDHNKRESPINKMNKSIDCDDLSSSSEEISPKKAEPQKATNEFMKFLSLDVEIQKMQGHRKMSVVLDKSDNRKGEDELSSSSEEEHIEAR